MTDKFRLNYFMKKMGTVFVTLFIMYYCYTEYIEIVFQDLLKSNLFVLICRTYIPLTIYSMIQFYLVCESVCPAYAELTCFGDRMFYDDWWNSTNQEEFNQR